MFGALAAVVLQCYHADRGEGMGEAVGFNNELQCCFTLPTYTSVVLKGVLHDLHAHIADHVAHALAMFGVPKFYTIIEERVWLD